MSNITTKKKKSKRIFYFDALRALAILSVILYHVNTAVKFLVVGEITPTPSLNWIMGSLFLNNFRFGVDLFLMLAGALSLGRVWTIRDFLGRRLPRIVEPYLFWIIVICGSLLLLQSLHPEIIKVISTFTATEIIGLFIKAFQSEGTYFYSYWFFWMILGTYLIMPIANKWLLHSDLKEVEYFLFFWIITSLFTFTLKQDFPITLTYFTSPLGMVVLGYYLRHTKQKIFNNLYIPILLIILGFLLELYISYMLSTPTKMYKFDRYSITMVLKVTGIFLLFRNLDSRKSLTEKVPNMIRTLFKKAAASLAKHSYGLYLIHLFILSVLAKTIKHFYPFERYKLLFLVLAISTVGISWAIMAILNRVPYVNNVIGSK
ncbi:acyltransferase [Methanobrevibacter sp.]